MRTKIAHSRGFTLVELMIVIAVIGILMTMSIFPFGAYMDRSTLRQEKDEITQEWILAHKSVRNGIQYEKDDPITSIDEGKHAYILFEFIKNSDTIEISLLPTQDTLPNDESEIDALESEKKPYKTIQLERRSKILGFTKNDGSEISTDTLKYLVIPPYGDGKFLYGSTSQEEVIVQIGYDGATDTNGRQKEIYLRPYLR